MINKQKTQERAAKRVQHLHGDDITCRYCGEQTASSGSMKGYVHRYGPTTHDFVANKPSGVQS